MRNKKVAFVYVLYSKVIDRYYTGCSSNPEKRLAFHNAGTGGRKAYTKRANDWKLVAKKRYNSREEACDAERELKKMKSRKCLESFILNRGSVS